MTISWTPPYNGGTQITAYTILIRESDGVTFTENLSNCDGSDATIITQAYCVVPISVLRDVPYSHDWGASIYAKV